MSDDIALLLLLTAWAAVGTAIALDESNPVSRTLLRWFLAIRGVVVRVAHLRP